MTRLREIIEKPFKYIGSKIPTKIKHMATVFFKQNVYDGFINYGYSMASVAKKIQKRAGKLLIIRKITFVVIYPVLEVLKSLIINFLRETNMTFSRFRPQAFYKVGNLGIHYVINV